MTKEVTIANDSLAYKTPRMSPAPKERTRPLPQISRIKDMAAHQSSVIKKLKEATLSINGEPSIRTEDEAVAALLQQRLTAIVDKCHKSALTKIQKNSDEVTLAHQGLKYLTEKHFDRVSPYFHLQLLVNPDFASNQEIASNSKLILEFASRYRRVKKPVKTETNDTVSDGSIFKMLPLKKDYQRLKRG